MIERIVPSEQLIEVMKRKGLQEKYAKRYFLAFVRYVYTYVERDQIDYLHLRGGKESNNPQEYLVTDQAIAVVEEVMNWYQFQEPRKLIQNAGSYTGFGEKMSTALYHAMIECFSELEEN